MKHLKIYEDFSEQKYIFTPDENLMKMVADCNLMWKKLSDEHEMRMQSLTGDRSNFPFRGNEDTRKMEKEILETAIKAGYKPTKPISNPPSEQDWEDFVKAIAPTMK